MVKAGGPTLGRPGLSADVYSGKAVMMKLMGLSLASGAWDRVGFSSEFCCGSGFRNTRKRKQSTTRSPDKHYVRALICLSLNGLPPYILPCILERPLSFSLIINLRMCTVILELHLDVIFFFRLCVIPLHLVCSSQVFLS